MHKPTLYFLLALSIASVAMADAELDEGVLVLTDANFDTELAKYDHLLVEFYAPWCGHCKQLAPEYAKAAKRLAENNPPYYLAKVDATENKDLAEKFAIRGFPTLFFFKNGNKMEYTGGRTENDIVQWILKKSGPPSQEVTRDTLKEKVEAGSLVLAFIGDLNSDEYKTIFNEVSNHGSVSEKFSFFHTADTEAAKDHGASSTPALILFRKFDESPIVYSGSWETTPVVDWMVAHSVPTLITFSEDYIEPIFGQQKAAIFLLRSEDDKGKDFHRVFTEASKDLKGQILFVESGVTEGIQGRLGEFIGVDTSMMPTIRLLDPKDNMKKFNYEGNIKELSVDGLKKFIEDFKGGKLSPFLKSEEIPADNSAPVKVIVGKSFKNIVIDSDSDVLMEFYAPWCGHCKKLAPIYDELAAELKDVKDLVIAKMDATANEVDGVDIRGYPTLKFYAKGNKSNPVEYEGERDLAGMKNYLKEKSTAY